MLATIKAYWYDNKHLNKIKGRGIKVLDMDYPIHLLPIKKKYVIDAHYFGRDRFDIHVIDVDMDSIPNKKALIASAANNDYLWNITHGTWVKNFNNDIIL